MLKVEHGETYGWEAAIRGMRNPMNSWDKSDSECLFHMFPNYSEDDPKAKDYTRYLDDFGLNLKIGPNDLDLMKRLRNGGPDDRKFMRQIFVSCDITAPLYFWKEADQYKVGTVTNSCSTMHKIHAKEFEYDDFSHEHLTEDSKDILWSTIRTLNKYRELYVSCPSELAQEKKEYWWQMIQLLPSSYNQKRTWTANYEVLANIYHARKNHKLDCWHTFCDWIRTLPYSELITGEY